MDKWYELNGDDAAISVISTFEEISKSVSDELSENYDLKDLIYPNQEMVPSNNVARSIMETASSHFGSIRPKPYALTFKGDYTLKRRAKLLNQFSVGIATNLDLYTQTKMAFEDAWICGDGFVQVLDLGDEIGLEYVPNYEVRVDPVDGKYGKPQSIYRHKLINKSVLKKMYPKKEMQIDDAGIIESIGKEHDDQRYEMEDACSVVLGWRKANSNDSEDGKYIVAIEGCNLEMGTWEDKELPIFRFSIGKRNDKYYSYGSVRIVKPLQIEIDTIHEKVSAAYAKWCVKIASDGGSTLDKVEWDEDKWFEVIEGRPDFIVPQFVSPDLMQYLQLLRQQAYELSGISEMHASSTKVPGVEAGIAIRELNDIQSVRFQSMNQDYERFHLAIFKAFIRLAKRIDERGDGGYLIMTESRDGIKQINWSEVRIDDDKFQLQIWPANLFSGSPAAQLQTAQDLIAVSPEMQPHVMEMMNLPDVQSVFSRKNSPKTVIEKIIEEIIDSGNFIGPQPFFDLKYGMNEMNLAYQEGIVNDVPEEHLDLMLTWIKQAQEILNPPAPQQPQIPADMAGPGAPPMGPEGMPMDPNAPPNPAQAMPPQPQMLPPGPQGV